MQSPDSQSPWLTRLKHSRSNQLGWCLAIASVATEFTVSGNLLTNMGSSYISEGGAIIQKIHPGSYFAIFAGIFTAMGRLRRAPHWCPDWRISAFLGGTTLCTFYALALTGAGNIVVFIDTFLPAGMLAVAAHGLSHGRKCQLKQLIQCLLILNACIALGELATGTHLVPLPGRSGGEGAEFRPTALYDHALTGAAATMLGLWLGMPGTDRTHLSSRCYVLLLLAALFAFGERTPLAGGLFGVAAFTTRHLLQQVLTRDGNLKSSFWFVAACVFACIGGGILFLSGAAETRLGAHLYWDDSAQIRLSQFNVLFALDWRELFFGCPRSDLLALVEPLRLSSRVAVIENFWLFTCITLGLTGFPIFLLSFVALLNWLWRVSASNGRLMIFLFLVVASASNSLGRKSTLLVTLVACVIASTPDLPRRGTEGHSNEAHQ